MSDFIRHFSPQRSQPDDLEKIMVQREGLLAASVEEIRESVMGSVKNHLLFIGPRGAGKTHMVSLIQYRLEQQPDLADRMRIAWLNEDETSTSFLKLLLRVYRALAVRYPNEYVLAVKDAVIGLPAAEAYEVLKSALIKELAGRTCVVIVENLDALFKTMKPSEIRSWRTFLDESQLMVIVGTAQRAFKGVMRQAETFHRVFEIHSLPPLTAEDARNLLIKLTTLRPDSSERTALLGYLASSKGRARLKAIHRLTGGSPRLYLILADFLTRDSLDALVPAFERMVDQQLTPYYQERLRWLSTQQREIVEYLCQIRTPIVPVKKIAETLFAEHSSVASQLKKLRDAGYVTGHQRGREVYYELAEPLMRLSFQVKEAVNSGRQGPAPLRLIVDMLRVWFEQQQLEKSLAAFEPGAAARTYFEQALQESKENPTNYCAELLRESLGKVDLTKCSEDELQGLGDLAELTGKRTDQLQYFQACLTHKKYPEALVVVEKALQGGELPDNVAQPLQTLRAMVLNILQRSNEAEEAATQAIDAPNSFPEVVAHMSYLRGEIRGQNGRYEEAIRDFDRTVGQKDIIPLILAAALWGRARSQRHLGHDEAALSDITQALDLNAHEGRELARMVNMRASLLLKHERWKEARDDLEYLAKMGKHELNIHFATHYALAGLNSMEGRYRDALDGLVMAIGVNSYDTNKIFSETTMATKESIGSMLVWIMFKVGFTSETKGQLSIILQRWESAGMLPSLGGDLVRSLSALREEGIAATVLDNFVDGWSDVGAKYSELEIPLRLVKTGVAYLKSNDEGELLNLPSEERQILREGLGLDLKNNDASTAESYAKHTSP